MKKVLVLVLLFSVVSFSLLHAESRNYAAPDAPMRLMPGVKMIMRLMRL